MFTSRSFSTGAPSSHVSSTTGTQARQGLSRRVGAGIIVMAMTVSMVMVGVTPAGAEIVPKVPMGILGDFSILAATAVTSVGTSTFRGNVGVWTGSTITGIAPSDVIAPATIHAGDSVAAQAQADLTIAYLNTAGRTPTNVDAELGGLTLVGGVYRPGSAALALTGTLTLDGANDRNSVFIFQTAGGFDTAANSNIILTNGAQECNVFFQVAGAATLGASSDFSGYIFAQTAVTVGASVEFHGGAFARDAAVTLDGDNFTQPTCLQAAATTTTAVPTTTTTAVPTTTAAVTTTAVVTTTTAAAITTTTAAVTTTTTAAVTTTTAVTAPTTSSTPTTGGLSATTTTASAVGAVGPSSSLPLMARPGSPAGLSSAIPWSPRGTAPGPGNPSSFPSGGGVPFGGPPALTELPFTGVAVDLLSVVLLVTLALGTTLIYLAGPKTRSA